MHFICVKWDSAIALRTLPMTLANFDEQPCTDMNLTEIQSGFMLAWITTLDLHRMVSIDGYLPHQFCTQHGELYGEFHRFDRSV
ncbi:hypothetical protein DPMN_144225 [Dreissena polymorpha]|uniref:Uncharacterized protein n=1 Tax=Dreissena polymorpha TaxID=45954 RepID=A0A9D4GHI0_DREPO|nr:hypothetical protein DPMN_144073 [Dreissena polymorpha]KAH3815591.1 hypothetical protein DPMN_144119 [Dreissena polymorpha]KAH3815694.1 hypothetical protein DPMN_144225 [Dreissena polymorpha]